MRLTEKWRATTKWPADMADTPFAKAAEIVDRRDGAARVSAARAWTAALVMTGAAFVATGGWIYEAGQAGRVAAYFVPVDEAGQPGRAIPVDEHYTPGFAGTSGALGTFVREAFSRPSDGKVFGDQVRHAAGMLAGEARATFNQWAATNKITENIGVEMRAVDNIHVLQTSSPDTFRVEWTEITWRDGLKRGEQRMVGLFTVYIKPPTDQAALFSNPFGIYIKTLSWQRA